MHADGEGDATMYDLTRMQLAHRVAEIERMRTRVQGAEPTPPARAQHRGIRVIVAQALVALAVRMSAPQRKQHIA
jgi:hypothetical protein